MPAGFRSKVGTYLDVAATVALAVSIVLMLSLFADLLSPLPGTVGTYPGHRSAMARAALFLGLLAAPTICCAMIWPIHLLQKSRGEKVFAWLRFVVLASAVWMWGVFKVISTL